MNSNSAVQECAASKGEIWYYAASEVFEKNDVFYFYLERIFDVPKGNGPRWTALPPKELFHQAHREMYMLAAGNKKVRQNDGRFVPVSGISTSLFRVLDTSWKSILSSTDEFDSATENISMMRKLSPGFRKFENAIEKRHELKITTVTFVSGNNSRGPYFSLFASNHSQIWAIDFDFHSKTIKFENISQAIQ